MAFTIQPLFEPVRLTNVAVAYYTATARTQIQKLTISNPSAVTAYTATVYWVASTGAPTSLNAIETTRTILPLETWDVFSLIGHTLAAGDSIQALASTTNVLNFFGSGLVMS